MGLKSRGGSGQRGASLVEFAIVLPLLIILLLGILEFGWALAQHLDTRHMAREALRVAVVDGTDAEVTNRICNDDIVNSSDVTAILREGGSNVGDEASVTITADLQQITGFFGWAWGPSPTVTSQVFGRVEQPATNWTPGENLSC